MHNKQLEFLINLQKIDTQIKELKDLIEILPIRIKEKEDKYQNKYKEYNRLKEELLAKEKEHRSEERHLQMILDDLKKFQEKIYQVKSQKEMEALDHEILAKRRERLSTEDKIVNIMIREEELEEEIRRANSEVEEEEREYKKFKEDCEKTLQESVEKIKMLETEREEIIKNIDKPLLELYEKLRKNKNNLAVAQVKDNVCYGCYTKVPTKIINDLKLRESIIRCDSCVRILYIE